MIKMIEYKNLSDLKSSLLAGEVDLLFGNFNTIGVNVDVFKTGSLFKEEYFVLSLENKIVNTIRSLKGEEVYTVSNTYLYDYLSLNGINPKAYEKIKNFEKKEWKSFINSNNKYLITDDAIDLLDKLLKFDFSERINARDALNHPYFKDLNKDQNMSNNVKK